MEYDRAEVFEFEFAAARFSTKCTEDFSESPMDMAQFYGKGEFDGYHQNYLRCWGRYYEPCRFYVTDDALYDMYQTQTYQYYYTMGTYDGNVVEPSDRERVQQMYDKLSTEEKEIYGAPLILTAECDPVPPKSAHDEVAEQYVEEMGYAQPPM